MTQVCLLGDPELQLRYELVSRETSREALSTYELAEPYRNAIALETVSLGAAVSLLNDLDWYLARFVREALVLEPSVSETEWLSRALATAIRENEITPEESGRFLKIYGIDDDRPAEPMFAVRTGEKRPEYDLREVEETLVVRVTESEFDG